MNRREFFKGLLGAGAAVLGIAVLPKAPIPIKQIRTNYVPGAYLEIGETMEQTYQRLDIDRRLSEIRDGLAR